MTLIKWPAVVSGYTNVQEMVASSHWTLQIHQVIKPFMIPSRFFYAEGSSRIPNLYQIRAKAHGSHFTSLRILSQLSVGHTNSNPPFIPVAKLATYFVESFGMREDFEANMEVLLKHGLIEANNRLEEFSASVDSIRITSYGEFMRGSLSKAFSYLELTCVDCAIGDQTVANELSELSTDEYRDHIRHNRMERIQKRIAKANAFVAYLEKEEAREAELFKIHDEPSLAKLTRTAFERDRLAVMKSARRNI